MDTFLDILVDTCTDCLKLLPFLFVAFLLIEMLEHYSTDITKRVLEKVGKAGPVLGALCGCIPQCGFSVMAANLFAGGVVSPGTLIAVFLATSDEAIIILLGNPGYLKEIVMLVVTKLVIAIIAGYLTDLLFAKFVSEPKKDSELSGKCDGHDHEDEHTGHECGHEHTHGHDHSKYGILISALKHTAQIMIYLFIIMFALNAVMDLLGEETFSKLFLSDTIVQPLLAALIGFIPNCAASVFITELYLSGVLSFASTIAGLCTGAGAGLLVLLRVNKHRKQNIKIMILMYIYAVAAGLLLTAFLS